MSTARVSRKVFYEVFEDVEDCLHAALEQVFGDARETIAAASDSSQDWRERTRAGLHTLLALAEQHRTLARVCVLDMLLGGPRLLALRETALGDAQQAIARGALEKNARAPAPLTPEAMAGGVAHLLHSRLAANATEPLTELTGQCMSMIVLPYLGRAAAERELTRENPPLGRLPAWPAGQPPPPNVHSVRLTYRTVRVLNAIREHPRASSREVAEHAGITDPGQASKLLKRLAEHQLIEDTGASNNGKAWQLTNLGREFYAGIRLP